MSNLNRQFLFRHCHVGQSKAHVAREVMVRFCPKMKIASYQSNIKSPEFTLDFFNQFDVFIMALDNEEARSYLNKIGMLLDIPIIEAGTTGYKGQGMMFKRNVSRCYDCFPREKSKVYQVCTIRTTPEKPIHCIVWAKFLFELCFGPENKENYLSDLGALISDKSRTPEAICHEIFSNQVRQQRDLEAKFAHLKPVEVEAELKNAENEETSNSKGKGEEENIDEADRANKIKSLSLYVKDFCDSFDTLRKLKGQLGLKYDKDNDLNVKFVTASANLRAHNYGIPMQSEFVVKDQSGNIIPAIASTNSIVAAIQVGEMIKFLLKKHAFLTKNCKFDLLKLKNKEVYVNNTNAKRLNSSNMLKPNPECYSCREDLISFIHYLNPESLFRVAIDCLKPEIQKLQGKPSLNELNFTIMTHEKNILYEEEPMMDEEDEERYVRMAKRTMSNIAKGEKQLRLLVDLGANQFFNSIFILKEDVVTGESKIFQHRQNKEFDEFLRENQSARVEKKKVTSQGSIPPVVENKGRVEMCLESDEEEKVEVIEKKKEGRESMLIEAGDQEGIKSIEEHQRNGGSDQTMQGKKVNGSTNDHGTNQNNLISLD